jgi:hypothetical protein
MVKKKWPDGRHDRETKMGVDFDENITRDGGPKEEKTF